jgi:hypothetical protein
MKTFQGILLAGITLLILWPGSAHSQFEVLNPENIEALKKGTTYIVMKDTAAPAVQEYIEIIKKYWTISKVEFIKSSQIHSHTAKNNFFLSIGVYTANTTASNSHIHMYLGLWTCKDGYLESKTKKKLSWENTIYLARIELAADYFELCGPDVTPRYDYYAGGHIVNWGPGIVKNYIQELMLLLEAGIKHSMVAASHDESELNLIKKQTLYIPDYVMIKTGMIAGAPDKKSTEKEIFSEYKYPYQLITMDELNSKILNDTIPFYYLVCVIDEPDKFVSIFNSQTGKMIYTGYSPMGNKFKKEDMLHITETINNKK